MAQDTSLRGDKSRPGVSKYLQGGSCPPTSRAYADQCSELCRRLLNISIGFKKMKSVLETDRYHFFETDTDI